ncbi:MAG: hypothetical protein AAFR75_00775 [Pseudomonadota bacterium]
MIGSADAAVRVCKPLVVGQIEQAATEKDAKRAALASWVEKSKRAGMEYPSWRLANNRRLRCEVVGRQHECVALGQPCTIRQVAPKPPLQPDAPEIGT